MDFNSLNSWDWLMHWKLYAAKLMELSNTQKLAHKLERTALLSIIMVCILISILRIYLEKILILAGQNPTNCQEAGKFSLWLLPALFGYATLQPMILILHIIHQPILGLSVERPQQSIIQEKIFHRK